MGCCKEDVRSKIPEGFSWTPSSSGSVGNGASSAPGAAPISCFYLIHFFGQNPSDELCKGAQSSLPKEALSSGIQAGNPPGWLPGLVLSQSCVFLLCCTLKVGRESSKIDTKTCFKRNKLHSFPLPSPRPKLSIQNSPCGRWEQREQRLLQPKFKAFHPILVPCPLPMTSVLGELRCMTTQRLWGVSARALRNGLFLEYFCLYSR